MSSSPFWNEDWMRVQQQYWENLGQMSSSMFGDKGMPEAPWKNAWEHWWSKLSPQTPDTTRDFMEKMIEQGKRVFEMSESLVGNMQGNSNWNEALNNTLDDLQKAMDAATTRAEAFSSEGIEKIMGFWEGPLGNWQNFAETMPMAGTQMPGPSVIDQILRVPGLGFTREDEERYKRLLSAVNNYRKAMQAYSHFFANLGGDAVSQMRKRIQKVSAKGDSIDSARSLYDHWIASCEKVYGERVATEEYSKIYGDLVNAQMCMRNIQTEIMDNKLAQMNMPTRRELQTIKTRLQETRRENRKLAHEVAALRKLIEGGTPATAAAPAEPAKKAAPKRKAAPKKPAPKRKAPAKRKTTAKAK